MEELDNLLCLLKKISENYEKDSNEYIALKKAGLAVLTIKENGLYDHFRKNILPSLSQK